MSIAFINLILTLPKIFSQYSISCLILSILTWFMQAKGLDLRLDDDMNSVIRLSLCKRVGSANLELYIKYHMYEGSSKSFKILQIVLYCLEGF